jgi:hypothetical protein
MQQHISQQNNNQDPRPFRPSKKPGAKKLAAIIVIFVIALATIAVIKSAQKKHVAATSVSIIIAPHLNDAILSLGGLIATDKRPTIIADFFEASTSLPKNIFTFPNTTIEPLSFDSQTYAGDTTTEESDLAQTIQALLVANANKTVYIYGPATFNAALNDPDTQILHQAFLDVATGYPVGNTQFFIYENYPAAQTFERTVVYSLKKNLQNESGQNGTGLIFSQINIPLTAAEVNQKSAELSAIGQDLSTISADQQFTDSRCGLNPNQPCETVYQIIQATSSAPAPY